MIASPKALGTYLRRDIEARRRLEVELTGADPGRVGVWFVPGTSAVAMFRLASFLHEIGVRPLSRILYFLNLVLFKCELTPGCDVGPGLAVANTIGVGIGSEATVGSDVTLLGGGVRIAGGGFEDPTTDGMPTVGDGCRFHAGAKVFGPFTIGARCQVGPNTWVSRSVPDDSDIGGFPPRVRSRAAGTPTSP